MALAGPGANLLLVIISGVLLRLGGIAGVFESPESICFGHLADTEAGGYWPAIAFGLSAFFSLNLMLTFLNLIPLPPLDGSAAIPLFLNEETAARYQGFLLTSGRTFSFIGLFAAWKIFDIIFDPLFLAAVNILYFPGAQYG